MTAAGDDSWQQLARDLEQAGHSAFAKRARDLLQIGIPPQAADDESSPPIFASLAAERAEGERAEGEGAQ